MDDYSEMIGETPPIVRGEGIELDRLGGPGAELSTGLILTWRDRLVFGMAVSAIPLGAMDQPGVSAFIGIGGHLDPGEGWIQAVTREAQEEASCEIALGDSAVTYLCRYGHDPAPIAYRWSEPYRPLLVWVATFDLRRGPQGERTPVTVVNAVFRAAALRRPYPGAEVPALFFMDPESLLYTYDRPRTVEELLERKVTLVGAPLPPDRLLAPGGSAYFYAQWLAWQNF